MTINLPSYRDINLSKIPLKWGYYSIGLVEKYCPDLHLIGIRMNRKKNINQFGSIKLRHSEVDYSWLSAEIEQAIKSGKKAILLFNDEQIFYEKNDQLTEIINYYKDEPVYGISAFEPDRITQHYRDRHGLECNMLEFPFINFNECLVYDKIRSLRNCPYFLPNMDQNCDDTFFAVTGRYESFRKTLLTTLIDRKLNTHGILTILKDNVELFSDLKEYITVDSYDPYYRVPVSDHEKMGAQFLETENIWLSCNTKNFLYIEQQYQKYPLVIVPESCPYDFFSTEKSFWPALIGKLFLTIGSLGSMNYMQKFYDVDMSKFLNLEFDRADVSIEERIEMMIDQNRDFILNSKKIYAENLDEIQTAKNTITPNMYKFLLSQLNKIE